MQITVKPMIYRIWPDRLPRIWSSAMIVLLLGGLSACVPYARFNRHSLSQIAAQSYGIAMGGGEEGETDAEAVDTDESGFDGTFIGASDTLSGPEPGSLYGGYVGMGKISYYSEEYHGRKTASGELFNRFDLTAASRDLPFNTLVAITNPRNERTVVVRINDRGPVKRERILDVSYEAAVQLDMLTDGVIQALIQVLD